MYLFRCPARMLFIVVFCCALLAGTGLDRVAVLAREAPDEFQKAMRRLAGLVLFGAFGFVLLHASGPDSFAFLAQVGNANGPAVVALYQRFMLWMLVACGLSLLTVFALALLAQPRWRAGVRWAVAACVAGELLFFAWPCRRTFQPAVMSVPPAVVERITAAGPLVRVGDIDQQSGTNQAMVFGLRNIWGYEPSVSDRYLRALFAAQGRDFDPLLPDVLDAAFPSPLLDSLGMRFVVSKRETDGSGRGWTRILESGGRALHENPKALPRARTVARCRQVPESGAISTVTRPDHDPAAEVIIEEPPPDGADAATTTSAPGSVTLTRDAPEQFEAEVRMARAGWFVLMDQMLPGWTATVDGKPAHIHRADAVGRALFLPPGTHRVAMSYRAPALAVGAAVSGAAWTAWTALLAWSLLAGRSPGRRTAREHTRFLIDFAPKNRWNRTR